MNGYPDESDEEVFLSEPASGDEGDVRTDDDYEFREADSDDEAAQRQTAAQIAEAEAAAPKGLPGLPSRPKGGLGGLPPKPGASKSKDGEGESSEAPAKQPAGGPSLPPRPAAGGGGPSLPPRAAAPVAAAASAPAAAAPGPPADEPEKIKKLRKKVQKFRVDVCRAALRVKYPVRSGMIQQLMYRLSMAERIHLSAPAAANAEEEAHAEAERLEVFQEDLDFSCTILVLGLSGVGKTAMITNLLGDALPVGYTHTNKVQVLNGNINGMKVKFIDTPGLEAGPSALASNLKILHSIKRAFNRHKPSAVLYVDRLDAGRRDMADLPVMKAITDVLGADIWFSTILTLTHATAAPPDGSSGQPVAQDMYASQRSSQVQQLVRQVTMDQRLMNPVGFVENSPSCPVSADGEPILPSGTPWRRQMLMLCFTTKVLNDANTILRPGLDGAAKNQQRAANPYMGMKVPPMGWLLSRLVDFKGPRKPSEDEREIKFDDELDTLPPAEKQAQLRKKRMYLKQKAEEARAEDSAVPILAPEPQLAPSFDSEVTSHRYKVLEDPTGILTRPIVSDGGVDHEDGVDSVHLEKQLVLRPKGQYLGGFPSLAFAQVTKDKNQLAFQADAESSYFHNSKWASTAELNAQSIGRDVLYTQRLESRVRTGRKNKVTAGLVVSKLGEEYSHPFKSGALAYGAKLDDRFKISPNTKARLSLGRVITKAGGSYDQGTAAAADLKLRPGSDPSTRILLGGSAVWQRRDTTYAGNIASEFRLPKAGGRGRSETMVSGNASYNNKGNGQLALRVNSHDYPQLGLAMVVPVLKAVWDRLMSKEDF